MERSRNILSTYFQNPLCSLISTRAKMKSSRSGFGNSGLAQTKVDSVFSKSKTTEQPLQFPMDGVEEEEEKKEEAWPITTMPICQLDNRPDFVFGTLPTPLASPVYADPESYQFIISKKKRVDRTLDVYYVGVMDPITQRPWSFSIGTPRCFVTFQTSQFENDAPNSRALVCPMYGDGQNPNTEPFLVFVNHLSALSDALKQRFVDMRCDVRDWMSPIREENGFIIGVPVKVKSDHVRQVVLNGGSNVVCCLKIICVYFANKRSGLSLELLDCVPSS